MPEDYADYDVLDYKADWDEHTREIVERRLTDVPELKFFDDSEAATLELVAARILPQDRESKIPIIPFIDEKLASNTTDGTRYEDMPSMQSLWRIFIKALDAEAKTDEGKRFRDLDTKAQDKILNAVSKGKSIFEAWRSLPAQRAFQEIVNTMATFYYAHPAAWNEIGWGGPKYPSIYVRLSCGIKDPKEAGKVGHIRDR